MSVYYFPEGDPKFANVISYSPIAFGVCPQKPFGNVSAEEFLDFAQADLKHGESSGLVNSFGNAKRCFHYQVDKLLYRFGLRSTTSKLKFPEKVNLLHDLDIISGTLVKLFNRERNLMEHEYLAPKRETVEGSIDLCELLLLATDRYLNGVPAKMRVVLKEDLRDLLFSFDPGSDCIQKFAIKGSTPEESKNGRIYKENIFQFTGNKLTKGISIIPLPREKIELKLINKERWLPILRMFSDVARDSRGRFKCSSHEPMIIIQHTIPMKEANKIFNIMETLKNKAPKK